MYFPHQSIHAVPARMFHALLALWRFLQRPKLNLATYLWRALMMYSDKNNEMWRYLSSFFFFSFSFVIFGDQLAVDMMCLCLFQSYEMRHSPHVSVFCHLKCIFVVMHKKCTPDQQNKASFCESNGFQCWKIWIYGWFWSWLVWLVFDWRILHDVDRFVYGTKFLWAATVFEHFISRFHENTD